MSNLKRDIEDYTHYHRTCQNCGKNWWGLHCPHDGYQNPCPECEFKPKPLRDKHCDCEFVVPVPEIIDLIESVVDNLKPDTNLLECDKHWSDDSGGT